MKKSNLINLSSKIQQSIILVFLFICTSGVVDAQSQNDDEKQKPQLGITVHTGYYRVNGDIDGHGIGMGGRIHIPVHYILSMRFNLMVSQARGLSYQPWYGTNINSGGLVESIYQPYQNNPGGWFPSYRFTQATFELEGVMDIVKIITKTTNINFDQIGMYVTGGFGVIGKTTDLDLLDQNGLPYDDLVNRSGSSTSSIETQKGRREILSNLASIYDGTYETNMPYTTKNLTYSYGAGLLFHFSDQIALGIEHKIIKYPGFYYADGIRFRTNNTWSGKEDSATYTNLSVMYKL